MVRLTRRKFITASAMGAGALAGFRGLADVLAQTSAGCFINSNFNGTPIPGGDYIWFNSVLKVGGLGADPVQVTLLGGSYIMFTASGTAYMVPVPGALITYTPGLALATTMFDGSQWLTNVPSSGLSGNVFLSGAALLVPPGGLPGGIKNVNWPAMFCSSSPDVTIQWQWAAAVYREFSPDYQALGVKPVDDNHASSYQNSDHAGTPENFKGSVTGGARGGGGSNFTGSYSGTANCTSSIGAGCGGGSGLIFGS